MTYVNAGGACSYPKISSNVWGSRGLPISMTSTLWSESLVKNKKDLFQNIKKQDDNLKNLKSPTTKKIGVGVVSCIFPGLGQLVNGQFGKAVLFWAGAGVASIAGFCIAGPVGSVAAAYALNALSIYDAVKNA